MREFGLKYVQTVGPVIGRDLVTRRHHIAFHRLEGQTHSCGVSLHLRSNYASLVGT